MHASSWGTVLPPYSKCLSLAHWIAHGVSPCKGCRAITVFLFFWWFKALQLLSSMLGLQVLDSVPKRALSGHEDAAAGAPPRPAKASPRTSAGRRHDNTEQTSHAHEDVEVALRAPLATPAAPKAGTLARSTVPDEDSVSQQHKDTLEERTGS